MDYTSHTAALLIPIAAAIGVVGMLGVLYSASRESTRAVARPPRIFHTMVDLPHRGDLPVGGAPTIGAQRTGSEPVETESDVAVATGMTAGSTPN